MPPVDMLDPVACPVYSFRFCSGGPKKDASLHHSYDRDLNVRPNQGRRCSKLVCGLGLRV